VFKLFAVSLKNRKRNLWAKPTVIYFLKISLAITGMNAVCPVFFKLISMMEQYHPRVALYWELTRYFKVFSIIKVQFRKDKPFHPQECLKLIFYTNPKFHL